MTEPGPEPEVFGWVTLDEVDGLWPGTDPLPEEFPTVHLMAAYEQCVAFLPEAEEYPATPSRKLAQVLQARALMRVQNAGDQSSMGPDGFTVTVFPMDWTVKNLLRPKRGAPNVL
ncbi:hypothetical protein [Cellulosimicrobium funkei]|uniref:hypothetical protein n=1 Tax=Cellulosimicrobium funkei TaxID=264251 RepID=UPI00343034F2